ncbi:glycerate kinase [Rhodococcus oxybenzonivorans]|uniref:glycerate kinase n=1 Tax=Rhodococcus TaxID=1827 RepID=UPI0037C797FB
MTVLIAPDSFKGTYTAGEVADAVAGGITTPHDGPRDPSEVDGTGAAGGFSGGMWARYDAELRSGAEYVLDVIGFDTLAAEASAATTGPGSPAFSSPRTPWPCTKPAARSRRSS